MSPGPALPCPYDAATANCGSAHGRRTITWTIPQPGVLYRNHYERAWFEVVEWTAWQDEPRSLRAYRRTRPDQWEREPFTANARQAIEADVLPVVARYGFGHLWVELHRQRPDGNPEQAVHEAERVLDWHRQRADLAAMHRDGLVDFVPLDRTDPGQRRVAVPPGFESARLSVGVAARAVVTDDHCGWMTDDGRLIPLDDILTGAVLGCTR